MWCTMDHPTDVRNNHIARIQVSSSSGREWTFRQWGNPFGLPILLVHGLGCSADDWDAQSQIEAMAGRPAHYLAIDLPGHFLGRNPDVRLPELAAEISSAIVTLGFGDYAVVGHSFGGTVALLLTASDERVRWCAVGGVGMESWSADGRNELVAALARRTPRPRDESLFDFLVSRGCDLGTIAHIVSGDPPWPTALANAVDRVRLLTTFDDLEDTKELATALGLDQPIVLPGDHVSSFLSGAFLAEALNWRVSHERHATPEERSRVLALSGFPGSGKTTVAHRLAAALDMAHVSSDVVRLRRFRPPTYSIEESLAVRADLRSQVSELLRRGRSVIVDATHTNAEARIELRELLSAVTESGHPAMAVWLDATEDELRARVDRRSTRPRLDVDVSQADVRVLEHMLGAVTSGWIGLRCDVTDIPSDATAAQIRALLTGAVTPLDAPAYLQGHAALAEMAGRAATGGDWTAAPWVGQVLEQVRHDRAEGTFDHWGESTTIDENVGSTVVADTVLSALLGAAGLAGSAVRLNAGLAHTYGYLFAHRWTPYGWKRERWLDGQVAAHLGTERGRLAPVPTRGTLLGNLTESLDCHLRSGDLCQAVRRSRLVERDPGTGQVTQTWLIRRQGVPGAALSYGTGEGTSFRHVTTFPVDDAYAAALVVRV